MRTRKQLVTHDMTGYSKDEIKSRFCYFSRSKSATRKAARFQEFFFLLFFNPIWILFAQSRMGSNWRILWLRLKCVLNYWSLSKLLQRSYKFDKMVGHFRFSPNWPDVRQHGQFFLQWLEPCCRGRTKNLHLELTLAFQSKLAAHWIPIP